MFQNLFLLWNVTLYTEKHKPDPCLRHLPPQFSYLIKWLWLYTVYMKLDGQVIFHS